MAPQNSLLRFRGELVAQVMVQSSLVHMILGGWHLVLHMLKAVTATSGLVLLIVNHGRRWVQVQLVLIGGARLRAISHHYILSFEESRKRSLPSLRYGFASARFTFLCSPQLSYL